MSTRLPMWGFPIAEMVLGRGAGRVWFIIIRKPPIIDSPVARLLVEVNQTKINKD